MKRLAILLFSVAWMSYSHADNTSHKEREAEISNALASRTLAVADDIAQSRRLYITAYNTINTKSEMSNELLIYTVRKVDSLIGNYEIDKDSFENDIIANKKITLEAVDGLCIMNKFIQKYSSLVDMKKAPPSLQEDTKRALSYQPIYLKRLSSDKDYLSQLQCINLK
ncbi:hypothetical protein [Acinetobacter baumannii]|uniref:hypothetical protein n=1 Tax=Acinetobacter baumannii TaxID=470 RepID=UPI00034BE8D6|nr:hypothetical protein [Acinetobacter baumannii]EHU2882650.1 hypothetical protein [Acinetobacter baumannii]EHU3107317.1 hypothetical protein [Acinetobacter baumannii]EHU3332441.1 hypothetical protein [Acinetobacter baumannii]EHU3412998.1 hypothetical protein [Acinetobacter baumannii]EIB6925966.1 hypothetical protein [Acinetobacter baumannii]